MNELIRVLRDKAAKAEAQGDGESIIASQQCYGRATGLREAAGMLEESGTRDWFADVLEFHRKLAPSIVGRERPKAPADNKYAYGFMEEELREIAKAMNYEEVAEVADGLADLIYVAIRAAIIWGIDLRPVWAEVHRANMAKEGGETRADGKVMKPEGWVPPDVAGVLARQEPLK